jgi:hypothetical protein
MLRELRATFSNPNDPGLAVRRKTLAALVRQVPPERAASLRGRIAKREEKDEFSRLAWKLSTATRTELLGILDDSIQARRSTKPAPVKSRPPNSARRTIPRAPGQVTIPSELNVYDAEGIRRLANRAKSQLSDGDVDEKTAISQVLPILRGRQSSQQVEAALGYWSELLQQGHPPDGEIAYSYFDIWMRSLDETGETFVRQYRDKLARRGIRFDRPTDVPSLPEYFIELQEQGELFKLKNFKGAARGMVNWAVEQVKSLDPREMFRQWRDLYREWSNIELREIGDLFTRDALVLVRDQMRRDFDEFSNLPEDQQAEIASGVLLSAYSSLRPSGRSGGKKPKGRKHHGEVETPHPSRERLQEKADADADADKPDTRRKPVKAPRELLRGGSLRSGFRTWALAKINDDPHHPLKFLTVNGKYRSRKGLKREHLYEDPRIVDASHDLSEKLTRSQDAERVGFLDTYTNQYLDVQTIEKFKDTGVLERPMIDIAGIPVDPRTAVYWVRNGDLNEHWVKNAKPHKGWNNDVK